MPNPDGAMRRSASRGSRSFRVNDLSSAVPPGESEGPGRGSRFTIRLPVDDARLPAASPSPAPARRATSPGARRLLLVDDNADAAYTLAMLLRGSGYQVELAADARAALAVVERLRPNLALLDIGLPGMDGHALARQLRADSRLAGLRLVALTGYGRDHDRTAAMSSGFDEHLVKPVDPSVLFDVLDRLLTSGA